MCDRGPSAPHCRLIRSLFEELPLLLLGKHARSRAFDASLPAYTLALRGSPALGQSKRNRGEGVGYLLIVLEGCRSRVVHRFILQEIGGRPFSKTKSGGRGELPLLIVLEGCLGHEVRQLRALPIQLRF